MTLLAKPLSSFLTDYLPRARNVSPHTIASYAHAFSLFLSYLSDKVGKRPSELRADLGFISCC